MLVFVVFDFVLACGVIVVSHARVNSNEPIDPFPLLGAEQKKVEVNISLAFLYWVEIALHPGTLTFRLRV